MPTAQKQGHKYAVVFSTAVFGSTKEDAYGPYQSAVSDLGGLLAGVVINVIEFITNGVVLNDAWAKAMQSLARPPLPISSIVLFNVWEFLMPKTNLDTAI